MTPPRTPIVLEFYSYGNGRGHITETGVIMRGQAILAKDGA